MKLMAKDREAVEKYEQMTLAYFKRESNPQWEAFFKICDVPAYITSCEVRGYERGIHHERVRAAELVELGNRLLERIDHNGGIGEYKGGPAFVVEPFRKALKNYLGEEYGDDPRNP